MKKQTYSTNTTWEKLAGYSRAVRIGNEIHVSGTTATDSNGNVVGADDPGAQTHYIIDKIEAAIQGLGGKLDDIYRTRIYIKHMDQWEPIARAHGERFADVLPANTLVQAGLIGDEYLVEIEAEAKVE